MNALKRIARGSGLTIRHASWYLLALEKAGGERAKALPSRLLGWGTVSWFIGSMLQAVGALWWTLVITWIATSLVAPAFFEEQTDDEDSIPGGTDETCGGTQGEIDIVAALHEMIDGRNGVHLAAVAARFNLQLGDVHALLKEAQIPTRHSVKIKDVGVAVGVHRDDLPLLPSPDSSPEESVVAGSFPGQSATATATYEVKRTERGMEAWFTDPYNPARTHIVQLDEREVS